MTSKYSFPKELHFCLTAPCHGKVEDATNHARSFQTAERSWAKVEIVFPLHVAVSINWEVHFLGVAVAVLITKPFYFGVYLTSRHCYVGIGVAFVVSLVAPSSDDGTGRG